jgi:hypothetical protein
MFFILGYAEGKFIGSELYNVMLFSLIPAFIYLVFYLAFLRPVSKTGARLKWGRILGLLGIPLVWCLCFLIFWCILKHWNSIIKDMDIIADQIDKSRPDTSVVRYLIPAIMILGFGNCFLALSNIYTSKRTSLKIIVLLGFCMLPIVCLTWFITTTPEVSRLIALRICIKMCIPCWVLILIALVLFCRSSKRRVRKNAFFLRLGRSRRI